MLPPSDDLEAIHDQAKDLATQLKRLKSSEVTQVEIKTALAEFARTWLRTSQSLKAANICDVTKLDTYDTHMKDLLTSSGARARASALRKKLEPFVNGAIADIIVPVIQYEGSPRQVAGRQIIAAFNGILNTDESSYIEEAASCVTVQAYRAAIIMLWAAAIARMHSKIVQLGFDVFNRAIDSVVAKKRSPFNRVKESAKLSSLPELQRSKDSDLLVVGMEIFGYDLQIYQELERLLGIRNDAAHPGMSRPIAIDVQQYATKIRECVFKRI